MYDILIKKGMIVDGTGDPWGKGNIAINDGLIQEIGPSIKAVANIEIDSEGRVVCLGFISP